MSENKITKKIMQPTSVTNEDWAEAGKGESYYMTPDGNKVSQSLVNAAPDLLEACEKSLQNLRKRHASKLCFMPCEDEKLMDELRTVLAKAKGE